MASPGVVFGWAGRPALPIVTGGRTENRQIVQEIFLTRRPHRCRFDPSLIDEPGQTLSAGGRLYEVLIGLLFYPFRPFNQSTIEPAAQPRPAKKILSCTASLALKGSSSLNRRRCFHG